MIISFIFPATRVKHEAIVDPKDLDIFTVEHKTHKFWLWEIARRHLDSFQAKELYRMCWIPAETNISEALTK